MADKVRWLTHEFNIHTKDAQWNDVAGIYIFCFINQQNMWQALYIGQADSFKNRLAWHERWDEAARSGATHVHAKAVSLQATRDKVEIELIQSCQPPLNTQHR